MKRPITETEFDTLMRGLVRDTKIDESELRDIAASPATWWDVQREIAKQKEAVSSPWPPANVIRRWLMISVPSLAAVALVVVFFAFRSTPTEQPIAGNERSPEQTISTVEDGKPEANIPPVKNTNTEQPVKPLVKQREVRSPNARQLKLSQVAVANKIKKQNSEIRSDFIALSYASNPDSGQLVRVKVPRSMMVRLGLVASVEKPSDLIDAEVLVGDDGLSRAIRFIR